MDERIQAELGHPLFIDVGPSALASDLESYVTQLGIDERRGASAYIFRLLALQLDALRAEDSLPAITALIRRAAGVPLFALSLEVSHALHRIDAGGLRRIATETESDALKMLRKADLAAVVDEAKDLCFLRATTVQHFVAPSGEHCEAFFRLGDAIRSSSALDRLSFWIMPALEVAGAIIIDNWSIASVALRALQQSGRKTPFDCLSKHPKSDLKDAERVISRMANEALAGNGALVFIISVTSSGKYAEIVRELARKFLSDERIHIVALFGLAGTPQEVDCLCTLDFEPKNFSPEICTLCAGNSTPVPLDPGLYYLKAYPESDVALQAAHFEQVAFIKRFNSVPDVFSVHCTDHFQRHHAFYVNVGAMIAGDVGFRDQCEQTLASLKGQCDLLVTPEPGVSALGDLAAQVLSIPRIASDSLRDLPPEESEKLDQAKNILVVVDVLISGSQIESYVKSLREKATPPESTRILVGLARPPSAKALRGHELAWTKNLSWEASLDSIERLFLPDWQSYSCPWCDEVAVLSDAAERSAQPAPWLTARIAHLSAGEHGGVRVSPLLLLPGVEERRLGNGSLAGDKDATAMATLFSVASALQFLRSDSDVKKRLSPGFDLYHVMAERNLRNYSESLLQAILLRTVAPREWGVTNQRLVAQFLSERPDDADADFRAGEVILWAKRTSIDPSLLISLYCTISSRLPASIVLFPDLHLSDHPGRT